MGAAGLTCSTCETAARAGTGIEIDLAKVPQRAAKMTPYEIMLSESQERMLIIVHKGREDEVKRIFEKWDLPWAEIGRVTDTGKMVVRNNGSLAVEIPARKLADEAPVYQREARQPEYLKAVRAFTLEGISDTRDAAADLKTLLSWPTIASKNWVFRQYDHMVRDGTIVSPGSDAAVIRIKEDSLPTNPGANGQRGTRNAEKIIALSVDCNAAYVYLDPYEGGKLAVAEAARNLACSGAVPLGTTDNLNFGNPFNPEIFWQLRESVRGLADACRAFNAPVTGGNVSLYNQNPNGPIDPTPTVAMVGLIESPEHVTTQWFKDEGDAIILLGDIFDAEDRVLGLGGSAYLKCIHDLKTGTPPRCNLNREKDLNLALRALIHSGSVKSAHDCSEGGLAVALAECCISHQVARETPLLIGAEIDLTSEPKNEPEDAADLQAPPAPRPSPLSPRLDALLFGESQARVIISVAPLHALKVLHQAKILGVPAMHIGVVGGNALTIKTDLGNLECPVAELHDLWWNSIARAMS
jgi:phosphoribosylformylglycinamidine synthase